MMQLVSKKFYEAIVPFNMERINIISTVGMIRHQDRLYQYQNGVIVYIKLNELHEVFDKLDEDPIKNRVNKVLWTPMFPSNKDYMVEKRLNRKLLFFRIFYLPYNRILIMSGLDSDFDRESKMIFQCHLTDMRYERLPDMFLGRTSFAAHYDFEDRYIYVVGGNIQADGQSTNECEKFDVYNNTWI